MCIALCTIVAQNTAQNRPDNFLFHPPDNHHCSGDVYLREGSTKPKKGCLASDAKYIKTDKIAIQIRSAVFPQSTSINSPHNYVNN